MLDYAQIEEEIKKIAELADKLPERYQVKCFEVLLNSFIKGDTNKHVIPASNQASAEPNQKPEQSDLPIDVKAFLMQYTIPDEAIDKLFFRHGAEIRPVYKITEESKGKAQMQLAMLAALENALKGQYSKFEFSFEKVRELCKRYNRYDTDHFKSNFNGSKRLFVNLSDEDHIELSPQGKDELANLVAELTK